MPVFWDTPGCPVITHTSDSHQIPSQNKTKSKLQIFKKQLPKIQILKFCQKLLMQHTFWNCLIRCTNMRWIQTELYVVEWTWDAGWTDGRTDRVKPIYPQRLCCAGGIIILYSSICNQQCEVDYQQPLSDGLCARNRYNIRPIRFRILGIKSFVCLYCNSLQWCGSA